MSSVRNIKCEGKADFVSDTSDMQPTTPLASSTVNSVVNTRNRRSQAGQRMTRVVFTLPNWTQPELDHLQSMDCRWLVIGKETCPTSGTPHLQGAVIFSTQRTFSQIKTMLGLRAHFEQMHGPPAASLAYCSKEDLNPFVKGDLPEPGKRNDLHTVTERILAGSTLREIALDADIGAVAIVKFYRGLTTFRSLVQPERTEPPKVFWIFGPTGVGKTRCCFDAGRRLQSRSESGIWISSGSLRWFDGYDSQEVVILDDFRTKHLQFSFFLRLLDRYPMQVEVKGTFVRWLPKYIFITCPTEPDECFATRKEHLPEDMRQLTRRITQVYNFRDSTSDNTWQSCADSIVALVQGDSTPSVDAHGGTTSDLDASSDSELS